MSSNTHVVFLLCIVFFTFFTNIQSYNVMNHHHAHNRKDNTKSYFPYYSLDFSYKNQETSNNVIVIIADDLGIEVLGMYEDQMEGQGRPTDDYPVTPILDDLASQGIRFNKAYSYPTCSPTRATLLTGRFGFRTGVTVPTSSLCPTVGIQFPQPTIPLSISSDAKKGIFGKWHLTPYDYDETIMQHILDSGFEVFDGLGGDMNAAEFTYNYWLRINNDNGEGFYETEYLTDVITNSAIDWLTENQDSQFLLWMAHISPHTPLHIPPDGYYTEPTECNSEVNVDLGYECVRAAIENMDTAIGKLLDVMTDEVRARTTIFFLGDNGSGSSSSDGQPFVGSETKTTIYEGGIRIPFFVSGGVVEAPGTTTDTMISTVDVFQTVIDIMGGTPNLDESDGYIIDSESFVSVLSNPDQSIRNFVFSEVKRPPNVCSAFPEGAPFTGIYGDAYMKRTYKLMTYFEYDDDYNVIDLPSELYDISTDPFEDSNLLNDDGSAPSQRVQFIYDRLRGERDALLATESK